MAPFEYTPGTSPLILSIPHAGTYLPPEIDARLNDTGKAIADTDWHVDRLYDGLAPGAAVIKATFHRYVIDANRGPDDENLYPGQNTTGLCPLTDFDGSAIWRSGEEPSLNEIEERREEFHAPYHAAITQAIDASLERHGLAVLYDCHSIRSHIPYLFDGELPALNVGTNSGESCSAALERMVASACLERRAINAKQNLPLRSSPRRRGSRERPQLDPRLPTANAVNQNLRAFARGEERVWNESSDSNFTPDAIDSDFSCVLNGRFKGGWTTRHYGDPAKNVHAIQMEIAQRTYMSEAAPWEYDAEKAETLRTHLKILLSRIEDFANNSND